MSSLPSILTAHLHSVAILAAATTTTTKKGSSSTSPLVTIIYLLILVGFVTWFFVVRPKGQQARRQAQMRARQSWQVGDEVATTGGIIGTIVEMNDERVLLEIADDVTIAVLPQSILRAMPNLGFQDGSDDETAGDGDYDADRDEDEDESDEEEDDIPPPPGATAVDGATVEPVDVGDHGSPLTTSDEVVGGPVGGSADESASGTQSRRTGR